MLKKTIKKPPEEKYWFDENKKEEGKNRRCGYCGKELPEENMWWCNSLHRFWNQTCGRRRMK